MNIIKSNYLMQRYIKELINNQNNTNDPEYMNLFSYQDYLKILKNVLELIKQNPRSDIDTLRYYLYEKSELGNDIKEFVYDKKTTPGLILDYGNTYQREAIICGNMQEIPEKKSMKYNTIFDLASTSKLFITISILFLAEHRFIDLGAAVRNYVKDFKYLDNVTINDLLKFKVNVVTDRRIDSAKNLKEAREILFTLHPANNQDLVNHYTDMGAIALKYVIENVTKMTYESFIKDIILKPTKMNNTFLNVNDSFINDVANENYSTIIDKDGNIITTTDNEVGSIYDPKAKMLGHNLGFASGHAGYFSTTEDMIKFAKALINEEFIKKETLYSIADSEIPNYTSDGVIKKHFGSLVYLKQLNPEFLGVYAPLSGKTFVSPGFCGTSLCIDPLNELIFFVGSNRLHNRIIKNDSNEKVYTTQNSSENYALDKEELVKKSVELTLQYELLNRLFKDKKEMQLVRKL